jgi:hypothetical protein
MWRENRLHIFLFICFTFNYLSFLSILAIDFCLSILLSIPNALFLSFLFLSHSSWDLFYCVYCLGWKIEDSTDCLLDVRCLSTQRPVVCSKCFMILQQRKS